MTNLEDRRTILIRKYVKFKNRLDSNVMMWLRMYDDTNVNAPDYLERLMTKLSYCLHDNIAFGFGGKPTTDESVINALIEKAVQEYKEGEKAEKEYKEEWNNWRKEQEKLEAQKEATK